MITDENEFEFYGLAGKATAKTGPAVDPRLQAWQWVLMYNYGGLAERLRFGCYSLAVAKANGVTEKQYNTIMSVLTMTRAKFQSAGGSETDLKKAIISGWGNGITTRKAESVPKATLALITPQLKTLLGWFTN
ncbi:hypothetical protein EXU85_22690 [Spirosoma sp. KCTC 42546]|uniref:hypothetical protein n=1 Tax=Spirosoma sp. KCTC 42546 TaxID=2520506 RepID=UPI0011587F46|nr:hypothetical protein [Spirosoma sp. KCTC 42546]QDK81264.1 hypothetical protein EXU85_22690 [Spirosoma sp. KCTC 42546]